MNYYVGTVMVPADNQYLAHHGIQGQKWGIRRYQNKDGSLTSEGQVRYSKKESGKTGSFFGKFSNRLDQDRYLGKERAAKKKLAEAEASGDEKQIEKRKKKLEKVQATRDNLQAYNDHTSTGKKIVQNLLLGASATSYRAYRGNGNGRIKAALKSGWNIPISMVVDPTKKVHGEYVRYKEDKDKK